MESQENKLYVGNLSYSVNEEELSNFFESNGVSVQSATVIKDRATNRSKGFGFVTVGTMQEVESAISSVNGKEFGGRQITVSQARAREKNRNFSRSGGNRGGRGGRGDNRSGRPQKRF